MKRYHQDREPFVQAAKRTPVDLREWAVSLIERDNRKSHLAPQLSPSTQDLLRSSDSPPYHSQADERPINTPTSGEIPIVGAPFSIGLDHSGQNRSPTRDTSRTPIPVHPGLGSRSSTTNSIPKVTGYSEGIGSANGNSFTLPVRPAPSGPLSSQPPRRPTPDESRRRGQSYGLPPNPSYGV